MEFGDWLCNEVVQAVPHRHVVLSIPKMLRKAFLYQRRLLSELSRCGWKTLKTLYTAADGQENSVPGAAFAIQTFGDFLGFHPHLHIIISDGCFRDDGSFAVPATIGKRALEHLFRFNILKMLLKEGRITQETIALLDRWRHTGFSVFVGPRIQPREKGSTENIARYIVRASFSQERMVYHRALGKVEYRSKGGVKTEVFDVLEWLAALCSHVPNKGEQMVRYYGYYSNVSRGRRKREETGEGGRAIPQVQETCTLSSRNWARLIQKIYEVDPLVCPRCSGTMRVIAFIESPPVIKRILQHLNLWAIDRRPRPVANAPPVGHRAFADDPLQQAWPEEEGYFQDPQYPDESFF